MSTMPRNSLRSCRGRFSSLVLLGLLLSAPALAADTDTPDTELQAAVQACHEDPAWRVGGAAIGDCLIERTRDIDRDLTRRLQALTARICTHRDEKVLQDGAALWSLRRDLECDLVTRSPGNTPAFVNGAACRLRSAFQRQADLGFLEDYMTPRCARFEHLEAASRTAASLTDDSVPIEGTPLSWRVERTSATLRLASGTEDLGEVPLDQGFCDAEAATDGDDGCAADGIHVIRNAGNSDELWLLVVTRKGVHGQRARLLDPRWPEATPELDVTGPYGLDWAMDDGRLVVTLHDPDAPGGQETVWWQGVEED
ncbi:lysozyme inhibitor LprI family protein [Roseibium aestuarii]|uniref:Lysozyme inhibitor LprI family protein n=1 Tax=Roseibium aestuarii TaxID=2600299 RepID=A0ABW4K1M7_9HYPH|nr:lysozyme inhibitor LprI family protein [Roseibium aestuarii]